MTPIEIELKNVTLTYDLYYDRTSTFKELIINSLHRRRYVQKKKDELHALDNVSLQVRQGERLGIIGHNGAGKSTLLKVISGILKPTHGDIKVHGTVQPLIEIAAGFNPEFSGRENIYLNGYMLGFTKQQIQEKEKEIIEFCDLGDFIDVPVKYYSSGMAVRLAFTIATSIEPEYLIFDEMLGAGDAAFFEKAQRRMNSLVEKAKAVVIVSHSLDMIKSFTTRTIVLDHGKIIFDGTPNDAISFYLATVQSQKSPSVFIMPIGFTVASKGEYTFEAKVESRTLEGDFTLQFRLISSSGEWLIRENHTFRIHKNSSRTVAVKIKDETISGGEFKAQCQGFFESADAVQTPPVDHICSIPYYGNSNRKIQWQVN